MSKDKSTTVVAETVRNDYAQPATTSQPNKATPTEQSKAAAEPPQPAEQKPVLTIEELKKELNRQLAIVNRKKELADNREVFTMKKAGLAACRKEVKKEVESSAFESGSFKLIFSGKGEYGRSEDRLTISNPNLIVRFIDMLEKEIDTKVEAIEQELLA